MTEFDNYIARFEKYIGKYIPPKNTWTPVDEAIYKPRDFYRIPLKEASEMQFKSIKYAFNNHYENNAFYRNFCKEHKLTPNDIKTLNDLEKSSFLLTFLDRTLYFVFFFKIDLI